MSRVVVIGGGYGGITVAGGLDDVAQVTLIEQKDKFVHHAAALRAAVDSVWGHTIFMPYTRLLRNGEFIQGSVLRVENKTVYVADKDPIEADYLVLASGSTYPFPAKYRESQSSVVKARLDLMRENLLKAKRVLLVGAGTVGIEFAGELSATFPNLEIVIVDQAENILGTDGYTPELRNALEEQLRARGIKLILGAPLSYLPPVDVGLLSPFTVETQKGVKIEADMWFRCYGAQTASGYLGDSYKSVIKPNGQVEVDEYMRVKGQDNVYAIGDITDVPESKRADAARAHARVVVANIRNSINDKAPNTKYSPGKEWVVLPLGPDAGASQLIDPDGTIRIVGPKPTAEIKGIDLMVTMVRGQLRLP